MKILSLLGLLALLTTSPMTNCITGQFLRPPKAHHLFSPVAGPYSGFGSDFGFLDLAIIVFSILLLHPPPKVPSRTIPRTIPHSPECPSGYTLYSNNCARFCYRFETQKCAFWTDARAACQTEGADLWSPDTCYYRSFQDLASKILDSSPLCENYWIGGSRTPPSNDYMTVRGVLLPNNFPFWEDNEPSLLSEEETCVGIIKSNRYLMYDFVCDEPAKYICQKFV